MLPFGSFPALVRNETNDIVLKNQNHTHFKNFLGLVIKLPCCNSRDQDPDKDQHADLTALARHPDYSHVIIVTKGMVNVIRYIDSFAWH